MHVQSLNLFHLIFRQILKHVIMKVQKIKMKKKYLINTRSEYQFVYCAGLQLNLEPVL